MPGISGMAWGARGFPVPLLASGGGIDPLVRDIGLCLIFAGVLSVLFTRLRIPSLAALLAAGVLLGPETPGSVIDQGNVATIASLGLVLLLFLIGLEMDLRQLLASGKTLLVTGLLQFPLCVLFGWGASLLLRAAGWEGVAGPYAPLYIGLTAAASSTLLVVRLLQERFQMDTSSGRLAVGLLIIQDVWAIVVLAVQPNFADPRIGTVAWSFLGIALLCGVSLVLVRLVIPVAMGWIARSPELVLGAAVGWCFGIGLLGSSFGDIAEFIGFHAPLSVSLEMGALIAGASLATHPFSHHVVSKVAVVHDFFITLFFVALGAGIPRPDGATVLLLAGFMAAVTVAARYAVFLPLLYFSGMDRRNAVVSSTRLAQISEFCLVIAYLGQGLGHVDARFTSAVIFAFVATALATPLLFDAGDRIHGALGGLLSLLGIRSPAEKGAADPPPERHSIVFLGFHRVASSLFHEIERRHPKMLKEILVIDLNAPTPPHTPKRGAKPGSGHSAGGEARRAAGVDHAKVAVCTIPDDLLQGTTNERVVRLLRSLSPDLVIIANSLTLKGVPELYAAGADFVYMRRVETAVALEPAVVAALGGGILEFRRAQEAIYGSVERRNEVLE